MIDVIIPVYNSKKTIEKTIMSLVMQRLSKQLCIILVDDGSTDGYDYNDLSKRYFKYFEDFKVITLPENHGVGYARQIAIKSGRNPWIYFIDSDDMLTSCYALNKLVTPVLKHPQLKIVYGNVIQEMTPSYNNLGFDYDRHTFIDLTGNIQYFHAKLYSRQFIMENGLTIPPTRSNEDIAFNIGYFTLARPDEYVHIGTNIVVTICNKESITRNKNSTRVYTNTNVNEAMDAYQACLHVFKTVRAKLGNQLSPTTAKHFIDKYVHLFCKANLDGFESGEHRELYSDIVTLYYRDIVKPILNANGINRHLNDAVIHNNPFTYFDPEIYTKMGLHNIHEWSENHLSTFNQERFDELCKNKITEVGYNWLIQSGTFLEH